MSAKERERAFVIRQVAARQLGQGLAAQRLGLSVRQIKRLVRAWREHGDCALVSRRRGRASSRRLKEDVRARIEALLRGKYLGFGPTLAAEKLGELEGVTVSRETIRRLQIAWGLWRPKSRRARRVFNLRERRPRFGELVQIDGSPHDWFEGRGPRCTLIVFIDDATGRLTTLQFSPTETARAYLLALKSQILAHGCPLAFYSDRNGIFRVNAKDAASGDGKTEFGRVAARLKIALINATTPQAKGRVERANQTLQDRLVKEMRLRGISSIEAAQAFAPRFIEIWNAKFAAEPRDRVDAHQPWTDTLDALDEKLARQEERVLSKALTFSADGTRYCVKTSGPGIAMRGGRVTLYRFIDGALRVRYKDKSFLARRLGRCPFPRPPKTKRPSTPASTRSSPPRPRKQEAANPNRRACKGVDNGERRYSAVEGRASLAVTHPHPIAASSAKRGHLYCAHRGDISIVH